MNMPFNVIAYFEGRPVGMVSATHPSETGETELISMWVAPRVRGKGVADALVAAVLEWADSMRVGKVLLNVMETNERAREFYRRHGFIDDGLEHAPDGRPEWRMIRG